MPPCANSELKGHDNPWFTELAEILHERNAAWARARKSGLDTDWFYFRQLRNKFTSRLRNTKAEFYLSILLKSPKKFWKAIKSLSTTSNLVNLPSSMLVDGNRVTDRTDVLNCFNKHFISSGFLFNSKNPSKQLPSSDDAFNDTPAADRTTGNIQTFNFTPFSTTEVAKALKDLDPNKSPGPDHLEPLFLKLASEIVAVPVCYIFNLTLLTNVIPKVWKSAFVIPLLKGGDPTILNNYRPISKLSVLAKVLEFLVSEQVKEYLTTNSILSISQSGFRKKHSTTTAALKVINDIIEALDNKQCCLSLFIDFSKAIDTVDHDILIERLVAAGVFCTCSWMACKLS